MIKKNLHTTPLDRLRHLWTPEQWLFLAVMSLTILLRVWQLPEKGILFGDAGHDLIAAHQAVVTRTIPLKGIATSIPMFHQGPLAIWLLMLFEILGRNDLQVIYVGMASTSILAGFGMYALLHTEQKKSTAALLALFIFATAPLAVAHSRMAYHITPIPLMIVLYLWSLVQLRDHRGRSVLLAGLAWGVLVQFELALVPLGLAIPIALWKEKMLSRKMIALGLVGIVLGTITFLAQIPNAQQWLVTKSDSFNVLHKVSRTIERLPTTAETFALYWMRFWSVDQASVAVLTALITCGVTGWFLSARPKISPLFGYTLLLCTITTTSYILRGAPSEAYMPPYFIYIPIIAATVLSAISHQNIRIALMTLCIALGCWNSYSMFSHGFFTAPTSSAFHYGTPVGEQQQIISAIMTLAGDHHIQLRSSDENAHFASYLDNYRYHLLRRNRQDAQLPTAQQFFIDQLQSELIYYPGAQILRFPSQAVIVLPTSSP